LDTLPDRQTQLTDQTCLHRDLTKVIWFFASLTTLGMIIVGLDIRSWQAMTFELWALACLIGGAGLGFIFAIPKPVQPDAIPKQTSNSFSRGGEADVSFEATHRTPGGQRQLVNTNLVEISDWLTKILVGVGLIQLKSIPPYARGLAELVAGQSGDLSFALALMIYFSTLGFLFGYLSTRLFLAGAFSRAERGDLERERKLAELDPTLEQRVRPFIGPGNIEGGPAKAVDEGPGKAEEAQVRGSVDEAPAPAEEEAHVEGPVDEVPTPAEEAAERETIPRTLAELNKQGV
jgi:hypothetical protein